MASITNNTVSRGIKKVVSRPVSDGTIAHNDFHEKYLGDYIQGCRPGTYTVCRVPTYLEKRDVPVPFSIPTFGSPIPIDKYRGTLVIRIDFQCMDARTRFPPVAFLLA